MSQKKRPRDFVRFKGTEGLASPDLGRAPTRVQRDAPQSGRPRRRPPATAAGRRPARRTHATPS
eukprot:3319159-Prymnesium_polylepis.2